ncbi:MAG: FAD-dependent oxidoreductase, partial [Desulfatirhabdiaceae bacterium]
MNFVIIGGDAAGMSAASRAKRTRPEMRITVIEKTRDVSFSACGMPYNIADSARSMEELVVRQADAFQKQGIDMMMGHAAEQIDRNDKTVTGVTESGKPFAIGYDSLLIATGARPVLPDIPGINLPGVMVLKHLEDGRRIKSFIQKENVSKAVIIGMGYIAMEMCEALCSLNIQVSMIKPTSGLLPWMNEKLSAIVQQELEARKVSLYQGVAIHCIKQAKDGLVVC